MAESNLAPEDIRAIVERYIGNLTEMHNEIVELRQRLRDTPDDMLRLDKPYDLPKIDSSRFSEEDRRAIYEDFLLNRFAQLPSNLSPDDFELQVLHLFGRWMVTYRKLWDEHDEAAGPASRELLIVGSGEGLEPVYTPV